MYYEGDHWKENGVDFYCISISSQKVRPGCYVENRRIACTGAIPGWFVLFYFFHSFFCPVFQDYSVNTSALVNSVSLTCARSTCQLGTTMKLIIDTPDSASYLKRGLMPTPPSYIKREHLLDSETNWPRMLTAIND